MRTLKPTFGFIIGLAPAILAAAIAEKPPLSHQALAVANGCFVETVAFLDHWGEAIGNESWARMVQWGAKEDEEVVAGHAVAVGETHGELWCWDINFGWTRLPVDGSQRDNVEIVAAPILAKYPKVTARFPAYRFDFPQSPATTAPVSQPGNANASIRDASIVGERLARHRPVNVVRFNYTSGDNPKESAAAIFVFHGRYCIYVPEAGTLPFRTHGSVENLRLVQDLLRRIFPGAAGLKKL